MVTDVEFVQEEAPEKVERKLINDDKKTKIQRKQLKTVILETKSQKKNRNQNSRYKIRQRAKRVGLEALPPGRIPDHIRRDWIRKLEKMEKELNI